jgi:hypothetical protein
MRTIKIFTLMFFLLGMASAILVVSPVEQEVGEQDIIDLGTIGPGQTISILIEPEVTTGGIYGEGGVYDMAVVSSVPEGWSGKDSKLYGHPLQVTVTAAPDAGEGQYSTKITVIDEFYGEKLDNITFNARVTITHDVVDIKIDPVYVRTGPGQPARFGITIINKGSTGDAFQIESVGAKRWEFKRAVFVPAASSKTIYYEITGEEEETYKTTINVTSLASPIIQEEREVTVDIHSSMFDDFKATNNGVLIFPIFEGLVYAFLGLIGNFF